MRSALPILLLAFGLERPLLAQDSTPPVSPAPMAPVTAIPDIRILLPVPAPAQPAPKPAPGAPPVVRPLPSEADEVPRVDSIQAWYYPKGKLGHKARVVLRAVIDTTGRVEPETISLLSTTHTAFVAAARLTFMVTYYRPGRLRGKPVRVLVAQPFSYDGQSGRRCELDRVTPMLPPRCW